MSVPIATIALIFHKIIISSTSFEKNIIKMGQTTPNRRDQTSHSTDILSQEMKIYQWRADPNFNQFVARVTFKSALAQHQQEKYSQFLRMQSTKDYLQIYKFQQELQSIPDHQDQQVIIFEKYPASLQQLQGQLLFQQTLFILSALLTGFEEIRKVYDKVVVDPSCCFVTREGAVRAWINPNPRNNRVWTGLNQELSPISSHVQIITRIIQISQDCLGPSKRGHIFFSQLSAVLNTQPYKQSVFSLFRRWINQYCYLHLIQMPQQITMKTKEQMSLESPMTCTHEKVKHHRRTEARQSINNKENDVFLETRYSEMLDNSGSRTLKKCKSMEKEAFRFSYQEGSILKAEEPPRHLTTQLTLNHSNSQILQAKNLQQGKYSSILSAVNQDSICLNKVSQGKESTLMWSDGNKTSSIFKNQLDEIPSVKNSSSKLSKVSKMSGPKFTEKEIQVSLHPSQQKIEQVPTKPVEKQFKSSMQVSIMKGLPQLSEKEQGQISRINNKYRTVYSPKESIQCINEPELFSRPWITTKTITKLVSENDNDSSIHNSISESSEYYNTSNYSGALTQLGRDVVLKKDEHNGRSRTVRVSRQI